MSKRLLNLGCGEARITGAVNVDMSPTVNPEIVADVRERLPFEDDSFDEIYFFHCIEHIEKHKHFQVLCEIRRVLAPGGQLFIAYPEFSRCIEEWQKNADRQFFEATIFGRQAYPGDYHFAAMDTPQLCEMMIQAGFKVENFGSEPGQSFNTVLLASKGNPLKTYEQIVYEEVFANGAA